MRSAAILALALLIAAPVAPASASPGAPVSRTTTAAAARASRLDATGRWIVVLRRGAATGAAGRRASGLGITADHTFGSAVHGFSAHLTDAQVAAMRADPDVAEVVPDGVMTLAGQTVTTGVRRIGGPLSPIARINGSDKRVDADVAIVDTGVDGGHDDLNVAGGYNCTTSNPANWRDVNGHGTHVAGTVGALDNGIGVVGVAPGVRLWSVRVLNSSGNGLVSWYLCGLDWITAQRDPGDPARPLFEAANMSVARTGTDDGSCGLLNGDLIHRAICRLVGSGVTVVVAAGNNSFNAARMIPASYDEVITVSALADTDGRPGGTGGAACYSWGGYDRDDTFADFSNYGRDVDLIAPGKCILSTRPGNTYGLSSGTSMATPHVTGAVALYKASRPDATPQQVKAALQAAGTLGWRVSTDPDGYHERLLDVSRLVALGDFAVRVTPAPMPVSGAGGTIVLPVSLLRAEDVPGDVTLGVGAAKPVAASLSVEVLTGLDGTASALTLVVPRGTPSGTYPVTVTASGAGRTRTSAVAVVVDADPPVAGLSSLGATGGSRFETTWFHARATWPAAADAMSSIAGYEAQWSIDGAAWGPRLSFGAATRATAHTVGIGHAYRLRVRARDLAGNWSPWVLADAFRAVVAQDTSPATVLTGPWARYRASGMSGGTSVYSRTAGASASRTFTGRGVAVVAPRGPKHGRAEIWLDGARVATVDTYAAVTAYRRIVFSRSWSVSAVHQIRVVVVGTAGRPRVDLDALLVIR